jgi:hypothetical protein
MQVMYKYIFLIIFCLAGNCTIALQKTSFSIKTTASDPVKKIVKAMTKSNVYDVTPAPENSDVVSQQNLLYEDLLKMAAPERLTKLATQNKNAIVRLYAYKALIHKIKNIPKEMVDQFRNDTTLINTINGNKTSKVPLNSIANGLLY